MRRKFTELDLRLSWRDLSMPVLREYRFGNGEVKTEIEPDYEQRYREMLMSTSAAPSWRDDPTYDLKRNRR